MNFTQQILLGENLENNQPPKSDTNVRVQFTSKEGRSFGLTPRQLSTHLLLVGGTGCGKSSVTYTVLDQLIPTLGENDLLLIFDAGGEYARRYFNPHDRRHILIGCGEKYAAARHNWNLFGELMGTNGRPAMDWKITAKEISKAIMFGHENQQQPFFSLAAETLINDLIKDYMDSAMKADSVSNLYTGHWCNTMRNSTLKDWVALTGKENFRSHRMFFGESERLNSQALGVFGEMNAAMDDTFGAFDDGNGRGEFSMRELVESRNGQIVFVEYNIDIGESQKPLLRLWFDLALKFALGGPNQEKSNIYVVCDELALLPKLRYLSDALNFGRAKGLRLICALQSINQFRDAYGEQAESLLAGFCSCFAFCCYDEASREYISKRFGKQYAAMTVRTSGGQLIPQMRESHVVEDWQIRSLRIGEAFIDLAGENEHPFRFYFKEHI